jgi:hypothetical protein
MLMVFRQLPLVNPVPDQTIILGFGPLWIATLRTALMEKTPHRNPGVNSAYT